MKVFGVLRRILLTVAAVVVVEALMQSRKKAAEQQALPKLGSEPHERPASETTRLHVK